MTITDSTMDESRSDSIDRRAYIGALSATAAAALAGCLGDDDGDGDDGDDGTDSDGDSDDDAPQGERVPTVTFQWPTGLGSTSASIESQTQLAMEAYEEHLGVECEAQPKEILTHYNDIFQDARECHMFFDGQLASPTYLDPDPMLREGHITGAGANGIGNRSQFADCEFSQLVDEQVAISDPEERRQVVYDAMAIASEAVERINIGPSVTRGAWRTDMVEFADAGDWGMKTGNYDFLMEANLTNAEQLSWNQTASAVESQTHQVMEDTVGLLNWNYLIYHPLVRFDKNYELVAGMASDWEISNNAQTFTFTLRDATFHNGDPVTPEDVKWTFEFLQDNPGVYINVEEQPYDSIEVVDDSTVEINLTEAAAPFMRNHVAMWGILPRDIWLDAGAEDNPENVGLDTIIGSGPYEVENYDREQILQLTPYADFFEPAEHDIRIQVYQDTPSAYRAFQNGDITLLRQPSPTMQNDIEQNMTDTANTSVTQNFFDGWLIPQMNFGPTMFREFRMAISQAYSRNEDNEVVDFGDSPPHLYSCFYGKSHPYYPDNPDEVLTQIADSADSNPDAARSVLEEAGWSWDDQDRLH